jgi:hypothetical protein
MWSFGYASAVTIVVAVIAEITKAMNDANTTLVFITT